MPAYIVKQPDGKFARFSTIVDDFTHFDMDETEARTVMLQNSMNQAVRDADRFIVEANQLHNNSHWAYYMNVRRAVHGHESDFTEELS